MTNPFMPERYTGATVRTSLLWHYTTGTHFREIVDDGMILPATAFLAPGERPIVWCSANPLWEPPACQAIPVPGALPRSATCAQTLTPGTPSRTGMCRVPMALNRAPDEADVRYRGIYTYLFTPDKVF